MKYNKMRNRNILLILHILSTALWLGGAVGILVLLLNVLHTTNNEVINTLQQIIFRFQATVMLPGGIGVIITGIILSLRSHWGIKKYKWVIFKIYSTAVLCVMDALLNIFWIKDAIKQTSDAAKPILTNNYYIHDRNMILIFIIIEIILLVVIIAVSVIKPGIRRKPNENTK